MNQHDYDDLKIPPHSVEAEQSVIGGLLLSGLAKDGSAWDVVASILIADDFYHQSHRLIFQGMADLASDGKPVDLVTLPQWLTERGELENAGGFAYLATMAKDTPSAANIRAYAEIVQDAATKRGILALAAEIADSVHRNGSVKGAELLTAFENKVFALTEKRTKHTTKVVTFKQGLKKVLSDIAERSKLTGAEQLLGASTSFDDLDEMLSGLCGGDLIVLAGRPAMGKSSLAGDFELAAATKGKPVLSFTLEMPYEQLVQRHLSSMASVPLARLRKAWELDEANYASIGQLMSGTTAMGKPFHEMPLYIVDQPGISVGEIRRVARRQHRDCLKEHGRGLGLITIDYLQLMQPDLGDGHENMAIAIGKITGQLKMLAKELNVPIVVLSQLNRKLEDRPNKRPVMSDLRDSGAVEQDADVILFVYRDEVYKPDSEFKGSAEIIIGKQRNGPIGTVRLVFQGQYTRFRNYTPDVYAAGYQ